MSCHHSKQEAQNEKESSDSLSAQSAMWSEIYDKEMERRGSTEKSGPKEWPSFKAVTNDIISSDYNQILQNKEDKRLNMYQGKPKILCAHGFVCCVKIEWFQGHGYTGMFRGAQHGIMKLSSALPAVSGLPLFIGNISKSKIFPCAALKLFRSDHTSANLLFAGKKTGQQDNLFFRNDVSTNITEKCPIYLSWVMKLFRKYSKYPTQLGISEFASV
jgi:predicted lipoprotein with Yx(FWY)xxD motif